MHIIRASLEDEERMKEFLYSSVMPGAIDIRFQRHMSFFKPYQMQSSAFDTYLIENSEKKIEGMVSLVYRAGRIDRLPQKIGLIQDLRLSDNRRALAYFINNYLNIIQDGKDSQDVNYYFTVLTQENNENFNSLLRPRVSRKNVPRYYLLRRFQSVWVLGENPFHKKAKISLHIKKAEVSHLDELADYLNRKCKNHILSHFYTPEMLLERMQHWPNFEGYYIATDYEGEIVGCVAPWNTSAIQSYVVENYSSLILGLQKLTNWTSLVGTTVKMPWEGQALNFRHLSTLFADNPDIFRELLHFSKGICSKNEFISYVHFEGHPLTTPPKGMIYASLPLALYTVLPPEAALPKFLSHRPLSPPPEIELFFA